MRSPFKTLPPFPEPWTELISILFSTTIFLTAGESVWLSALVLSSDFSILDFGASSSITSSVKTNGSCRSFFSVASSKIFGSFLDGSNLITLSSFWAGSTFLISSFLIELTDPLSDTKPSNAPTSTTEPSFEFISVKIPFTGDGTSRLTLSVSSSTIGSSASTASPVFLSHFATVASVILSPRTGTTIFSLIYNYSNTLLIISCCWELCLFAYPVAGDASGLLPI